MLISDILDYTTHHAPEEAALWFEEDRISYSELRDRCYRLSNSLLNITKPGDRVAVLSENCPEYVECYYGVPGAGMVLTLLNYRLSGRELTYIINNSEPSVLIVEAKYLPLIRSIRDAISSVQHVFVIEQEEADREHADDYKPYDAFRSSGAAERPDITISEDDVCWLIYTSGTTGLPRGAMLTHHNLMTSILNSLASWDRGFNDIYLFTFPLFHVAGYAMPMQHLRGIPVVLIRNFDAGTLFSLVERHKVTSFAAAPTMIAMLLEHPDIDRYDLSTLRNIGYGASAMPAEVIRRTRARWPSMKFGTGFGMTELAGNVMVLLSEEHDSALQEGSDVLSSVGRQMPLSKVRVVDEDGKNCPPNVPGEIVVKGEQVLKGYWRNPEATEKSFKDGWFQTGDVGRWSENGYLFIVDRKKDMILSGGESIYPREVEEILYEHPAVIEAAVIGVPDEKWGEIVVAILTTRGEIPPSDDEIIAFTRERIASYKKPRHVVFVNELPKNASGKF